MIRKKAAWITIIALIVALGIGGCSSKSSYTENMQMAVTEEVKRDEDVSLADKGTQIDLAIGDKLNRKIIKTGEIGIETKNFENTINSIFERVKELGGFIESSYIEGNSYNDHLSRRSGEIKVRIPDKVFDQFINKADAFGNVINRSMQGEDITDAYVDTVARLKSLTVQRERLMKLLEKSGALEELFAIEKELANVNYQIEQFQGTLNKYDSLIDYATVQVRIEEVIDYQNTKTATTFRERIAREFQDSLKGVKNLGEKLVLLLVGMAPFVVVVGIPIITIVIGIIMYRKKIRETRKDMNNQENHKTNGKENK